ncbi:MAG TPA: type I-C CRISPR-associated protein Cas8c/Csd1 [Pirellulales bacterium]|jgi:CRISPR-associated protein Csd1
MLQALYQMAQEEGLMADPDFEPKPVAWLVRVGDGGKLILIEDTRTEPPAEGKRKPKPVAKSFRIPRQPTGRSGTKAPAAFLVDNAKYVFGLPTADKNFSQKEGAEKSASFRKLVTECAETTRDKGVLAVLQFLQKVAAGKVTITLPEDCKSNDLFAFVYAPDVDSLVHDRAKVRDYWKERRQAPASDGPDDTSSQCLVTGAPVGKIGLFPLIKRVPGGATAGVGLVSFNANAFESHGWKNNENAPISRQAAEACSTALNRLLSPNYPDPENPQLTLPTRHIRLSDDTIVCYWGRGKQAGELADGLAELFNPSDPGTVADLYRSLWTGRASLIDDPSAFYAVTLSGAQGRAVVRDWFETTVREVAQKLREYFQDLAIIVPVGIELSLNQCPSLFKIRSSIARDPKELPAPLMRDWWRVAIGGSRIPDTILHRALARIRTMVAAGERPYPTSYALLKSWLIRNREESKTMNNYFYIDKRHVSRAYHCGRMLALMGFAQTRARGNEKDRDKPAQIVQRYFGAVMTAPGLYLGRLQRLMITAHLPKLEWDWPGFISDELGQINSQIRGELPRILRLEDQSRFALGYHHELSWLDSHPPSIYHYRTKRGDHWVRSRGEEAIANGLFELGIDYEYEPTVLLPANGERWPDFRIPAKSPKDQVLIEFLGMLDNPKYREDWEKKREQYRALGILSADEGGGPNGTLYWIEGDDRRPDATTIRDQLRAWFKPLLKDE